MATYDDLFGNKSAGPKRAPAPRWNEPGDTHVGVISAEPYLIDDVDFKSKKAKFMVQTDAGWKMKLKGEFDESDNHFPIQQIVVPVTLKDGAEATFYFAKNDEALKDAMADTGIDLVPGVTIGKKFVRLDGQRKKYSVKLVAPSE